MESTSAFSFLFIFNIFSYYLFPPSWLMFNFPDIFWTEENHLSWPDTIRHSFRADRSTGLTLGEVIPSPKQGRETLWLLPVPLWTASHQEMGLTYLPNSQRGWRPQPGLDHWLRQFTGLLLLIMLQLHGTTGWGLDTKAQLNELSCPHIGGTSPLEHLVFFIDVFNLPKKLYAREDKTRTS